MNSRAAERRNGFAALALVVVTASACGGGTTPPASSGAPAGTAASASTPTSSSPSTLAAAGDSTQRPEGAWTLVTWPIKRSDTKDFQPIANISNMMITPSCTQGPCDLAFSTAESSNTSNGPGPAPTTGAVESAKLLQFHWDGTSYVARKPAREVSCTAKVGAAEIPKGYTSKSTFKLSFLPPSAGGPARVHGTVIETNTGTKAGKGKGCRDFTETSAVSGSSTGSVDAAALPQGAYDASMSSTGSTPKSLAPVGAGFWLGPMTASGTKDALTITGMTSATAPLAPATEGWDGNAPGAPMDCEAIDGSPASKGSDGLESFSGLHPVAVTKSGDPIFSGTWRLRTNPNKVGLKAGCSLTRWEGRLLLVPHGAGL
ncbi:MAG: hypothetical protein L0H96_09345 [Humibacillus sp.]|nr:hypothetical protein [Humibacillus sp.]MDN5777103.1 hypothetical protein [Humibacillus sp.]